MASQFKNKTLRRATKSADFDLYKAALEWDLIDPIVIEDRDDIKSEYRWRDLVNPYHHQVTNLITFCRRLPVTLLADDVGLGKTISAGLIASELISRGRLTKILIVCPKILREQWKEELETKFDIPSVIATGRELITTKPPGEAGAVITTYQSARLYLDRIEKIGYEMLILDEAHKLRNLYGVDPTPQVAIQFRKALSDRLFKYVLMLTATPIQNRLWDLYSLVDLLTVARGHENPFGNEGTFVRKFIADKRTQARELKPEAKDEFRSIVYGYMSRIRRGDADLHFPERIVKLHTVEPTPEEMELIKTIAGPIQQMVFFAQIIILQALISSPEALVKVLEGMAKKGTAPQSLATAAKAVAKKIPITAKLTGLSALVDKLSEEKPEDWRMVVFTRWRETQTTIQNFLEQKGISCGLINGESGSRNQETIAKFKKDHPDIHVIISTEAGAEGVNLQAANVLINYDLPWNPMIVEQRIGRIQRLSSNFAKVSIFNIVLKGTFEEYIVGRLMEKLQMAAHAIGDIEALLEASGIDEEENGSNGFEDKIRQLVVASLAGKDIKQATLKAEESIKEAKLQLEQEEKNINSLLGKMDGAEDSGPKCPKLPDPTRSMDVKTFVLTALESLGANVKQKPDHYISVLNKHQELIRFDSVKLDSELASTLYAPGAAAFERLVSKVSNRDLHLIEDSDTNIVEAAEKLSKNWVKEFDGKSESSKITEVRRCYEGIALVRVRANVACDSYERLVEIACSPKDHNIDAGKFGLERLNEIIETPSAAGIVTSLLDERSQLDQGIAEFCRFYIERRAQELVATGNDARKIKKIEDDFTPRIESTLVGLKGKVTRQLKMNVPFKLDGENKYESIVTLDTHTNTITNAPDIIKCEKTGKLAPEPCMSKCAISEMKVLHHLLISSEVSGRMALPEYIVVCGLSGKKVLNDEVEKSSVTEKLVSKTLLKTSALSGKVAEPEFFVICEFSKTEVLESESEISQVSGKHYRIDEQLHSNVSGKTGHREEFIFCSETGVPLLSSEAETCEITGKVVVPGILEVCEITNKKVLPTELEKSSVSGKKALKKYFVSSSLSGARVLEEEAIKSITGKFCAPLEARLCIWSGRRCHTDDLRTCELTGLSFHFEYVTTYKPTRFEPLVNLLDGIVRGSDNPELWDRIVIQVSKTLNSGNCKIEATVLSPDGKNLVVSVVNKKWVGFQVRHAGLLYSIRDKAIIGRLAYGKREPQGWIKK